MTSLLVQSATAGELDFYRRLSLSYQRKLELENFPEFVRIMHLFPFRQDLVNRNSYYSTVLCKATESDQACKVVNCQFAHTEFERVLYFRNRFPKGKTKICPYLIQEKACPRKVCKY